jgi:hypothetical protein
VQLLLCLVHGYVWFDFADGFYSGGVTGAKASKGTWSCSVISSCLLLPSNIKYKFDGCDSADSVATGPSVLIGLFCYAVRES